MKARKYFTTKIDIMWGMIRRLPTKEKQYSWQYIYHQIVANIWYYTCMEIHHAGSKRSALWNIFHKGYHWLPLISLVVERMRRAIQLVWDLEKRNRQRVSLNIWGRILMWFYGVEAWGRLLLYCMVMLNL